jgi:DoxX-like family
MSINRERAALVLLRWTVGLVVLWQSYRFTFFGATAGNHLGLPPWIVSVIGGAELLAAVLFLVPKLERLGGYALLTVFAVAAAIHGLHGELELGLAVDAAAVVACLATRSEIAGNPA